MVTWFVIMKNTGEEYEHIVSAIHKQFGGTATITDDEKIKGKSGIIRQIDVAIRSQVAGYDVLIIIQAKDYKRKVDIEKVDSLIGTLVDVGAAKAVLVSDSGFTKGAIGRAREDGHIELVSVIDVENQKLKARIGIPTLAEIIGVESMAMKIEEKSKIQFVFTSQMMHEARMKFNRLWNEGKLKEHVGEQEYVDVLIDKPEQKFAITYSYNVVKKFYFKAIGLQKGSGIFTVTSNSFRSKSITTEIIQLSEIVTTWKEVDISWKAKAVIDFGLVAALPDVI